MTRFFTREQTAAWAALRELCSLDDVCEMVRQDDEAGDGSRYPSRTEGRVAALRAGFSPGPSPYLFRVYPDPETSEVSAEHASLAEALQEQPGEGHAVMRGGTRYAAADGVRWELTGNGLAEARR